MLIDKIVCVGVGQCGSNLVVELENLGFSTYYINTSLEDLDTINTDKKNKFHIKGTKGMAKDRILATQCILDNNTAENIAYSIYDQYAMSDIVYFFYSLSGGTGGTMGNFIAEQMADLFPDKTINVVAVLPKSTEDVGLQANAIESLKHLKEIHENGTVSQVHLLDNNAREDIFSINKDFAVCLSRFVTFNEINKTGNLDEEERERLLMEQGMAVMLEFSDDDFGKGLTSANEKTIYAEWIKNPTLHGLILNKKQNKEENKELIKDVLGMATYTHQSTWDKDSNVLLSVGMKFNENILAKVNKNAKELLDRKKKIEEEMDKIAVDSVEFDTSSIISSTNKRRNTISQSTNPRRRGEKKASSVLDKYRNM